MALEAALKNVQQDFERACTSASRTLRVALEEELAGQRAELARRAEALDQRQRELDRREAALTRREKALQAFDENQVQSSIEINTEPDSPVLALLPLTPTPARAPGMLAPTPSSTFSPPMTPQFSFPPARLSATPVQETRVSLEPAAATAARPEPQLCTTPIGSTSHLKALFEQKAAMSSGRLTTGATGSNGREWRRTSPPVTLAPPAPKMSLKDLLQLDQERLDRLTAC